MFYIFLINEIFKNSKAQKLSKGMFFIKNYIIKFFKWEQKQNTWYLLLYKQWLSNVKKFIKLTSNSTQNREKKQNAQKDKKTSFPKESVENVDPYQPVLNKIMIKHEQCVECYFVAPLKITLIL